ncbi:LON peptidase N-terminal domain and RING finger protein 2 [Oleoguttula sp. CCFEE 5521]
MWRSASAKVGVLTSDDMRLAFEIRPVLKTDWGDCTHPPKNFSYDVMADDAGVAADRRPGDLTVSGGVNVASNARLHIGNINNLTNYKYTLAKRKSDETLRSDRRNEELLRATAEGQTPRVRHLLELEADFDYRDELDLTALHHAVLSGFEDVVSLLIQRGADVNSPSLNVGTPLILAVLKQRSNVVKLLLSTRGINVDAVVGNLGSAMHCAAWCADMDIVEMLVGHGTAIDRERRLRCEADIAMITVNAVRSWSGNRGKFLADAGHGYYSNAMPILLAVLCADRAVVKLMYLEDMALDRMWCCKLQLPSAMHADDRTTSECSWRDGQVDLVSIACNRTKDSIPNFLILHGAKSDRVYEHGTALLMRAATRGDAESLKVLFTKRTEVDRRGPAGRTALIEAAEHGWKHCVEVLRAHGAQDSVGDDYGDTPLHYASSQGKTDIVQLLIESGADVSCVNKEGETALHHAFDYQQLSTVLCLINAGAKCDLRDNGGTSLLHLLLEQHEQHGFTGFVADFAPWPLEAMSLDQETLGTLNTGEPNVLEQILSSAKAKDIEAADEFDVRRREAFLLYCASCMEVAPRLLGLLHALGGVVSATMKGLTCIHIAVVKGNAAAVQDLLAFQRTSGLIVNASLTSVLNECLAVAAEHQNGDVVGVLLRYGADPNFITSEGRSSARAAVMSGSTEIRNVLISSGGRLMSETGDSTLPHGPVSPLKEVKVEKTASNDPARVLPLGQARGLRIKIAAAEREAARNISEDREPQEKLIRAVSAERHLSIDSTGHNPVEAYNPRASLPLVHQNFRRSDSVDIATAKASLFYSKLYEDTIVARRNRSRSALEFMSAAITSRKTLADLNKDVHQALGMACPYIHVLYGELDRFSVKDSERVKRVFVCTPKDPTTLKTQLEFEINIVKVPLMAKIYAVVFKQQNGDESLYTETVNAIVRRLQP